MNELIIDKEDLLYNINEIKSKIKDDNYTIIAVVKGNAYGLGIIEFTNFLIKNGFDFFAVASIQEALTLRENNIKEKILLLTPCIDKEYVKKLIENDITLTIDSIDSYNIANNVCRELNKKVTSHIKIDTGLSRYGFCYDDIDEIMSILVNNNITFEGIYTHFSNSLAKDQSFSNIQYDRFIKLISILKEKNINFKYKHICNSSGFFKYPNMHLNAARIGSAFTGVAAGENNSLKKIGTLHTKVTKIRNLKKNDVVGYANSYICKKDIRIAILPTGYFDGIGMSLTDLRYKFKSKIKKIIIDILKLKNGYTYLKINGEYFKVIGQIGMHDVVIDITGKDIKENDDIYIDVRTTFIDSSIKRVYR